MFGRQSFLRALLLHIRISFGGKWRDEWGNLSVNDWVFGSSVAGRLLACFHYLVRAAVPSPGLLGAVFGVGAQGGPPHPQSRTDPMSGSSTPSPSTSSLNRRTLIQGAAWSVPVFAAAAATPAFAASAECAPVTASAAQTQLAFAQNFPRWTRSTPTNRIEYRASFYGLNTVAVVENNTAGTSTMTSDVLCLGAGTYTFTFSSVAYVPNTRWQSLKASLVSGASELGSTTITTEGIPPSPNTHLFSPNPTFQVTLTRRTQVQFVYAWTTAAGGNQADDIAVTAPTVTVAP